MAIQIMKGSNFLTGVIREIGERLYFLNSLTSVRQINWKHPTYSHHRKLITEFFKRNKVSKYEQPLIHCAYFSKKYGISMKLYLLNLAIDKNFFGRRKAAFKYLFGKTQAFDFLPRVKDEFVPTGFIWNPWEKRPVRLPKTKKDKEVKRPLVTIPASEFFRKTVYAKRLVSRIKVDTSILPSLAFSKESDAEVFLEQQIASKEHFRAFKDCFLQDISSQGKMNKSATHGDQI